MTTQVINYEVIGKAVVERGGDHISYALKLLYKGDGTPWWSCSAGLELPVSEAMFNQARAGGKVLITIEPMEKQREALA